MMKKNYTVMFLFFFMTSIAGGMALKDHFYYSVVVGVSFGLVFLLCSAFFAGKREQKTRE
ncbi:hypothetical protein FZW96_13950 [Bacillus sp. BGMRC 2118]|nr:hypothetical protein FZW96_13950 [Bacillus sp. BGMRC 2118]